MSGYIPEAASGHWLTAREVARASELREDLVERFLPAADPPEPLYSADLVSIAQFVRQLADLGTPAAAIEVAVTELRARPDDAFSMALGNGRHRASFDSKRRRILMAVGASAVVALVIGGIVSAVGGHPHQDVQAEPHGGGAAPAEVVAPAAMNIPKILTTHDPVCAQWEHASASFGAKLHSWAKTDQRVPAAKWSRKQREITLAVIPVLRDEASGLRKMADAAVDPLLADVLRGQATYEDAFAGKLPKFEPADRGLWNASSSLSASAKAICSAAR